VHYQSLLDRLKDKKFNPRDWNRDDTGWGVWVPRDVAAVEYARCHIRIEAFGPGGRTLGVRRSRREDEVRAALAGLEVIIDNRRHPDIDEFIAIARKQRSNPPKAQALHHKGQWSYWPRYRTITWAVDAVRTKYSYRPTPSFVIVSEALQREGFTPSSKDSVQRIWREHCRKTS